MFCRGFLAWRVSAAQTSVGPLWRVREGLEVVIGRGRYERATDRLIDALPYTPKSIESVGYGQRPFNNS